MQSGRYNLRKVEPMDNVDKYSVSQYSVKSLLGYIDAGDIAIPEIQRPFVWSATQVRDLVDSLYSGYPTGYLIIWQNPDVKLKDGSMAIGKRVLIDGQQRITAMTAALVGKMVLDDHYKWKSIAIAFNPLEEMFEVSNNAIRKSPKWIPDIAEIFKPDFKQRAFENAYAASNEGIDLDELSEVLTLLMLAKKKKKNVI